MTRQTNSRVAGLTFLLYIVLGLSALVLSGRAGGGPEMASRLAGMARHASDIRLATVLNLLTGFAALILGVTLYALTRDQDRDLALLALVCRVVEGVLGGLSVQATMGVLWLATATGSNAPSPESSNAIAAFILLGQRWSPTIGAMFFSVGSTLFSWLLLRGRTIPAALAWLGVVASALLVVALPLQIAGVLRGSLVMYLWLPMAAFEIPLAFWLLIRGAAAPARAAAA